MLVVQHSSGYPRRPPGIKLDADETRGVPNLANLESHLTTLAAELAAEGEVMVFNLVEALRERLSDESSSDAHAVDQPPCRDETSSPASASARTARDPRVNTRVDPAAARPRTRRLRRDVRRLRVARGRRLGGGGARRGGRGGRRGHERRAERVAEGLVLQTSREIVATRRRRRVVARDARREANRRRRR